MIVRKVIGDVAHDCRRTPGGYRYRHVAISFRIRCTMLFRRLLTGRRSLSAARLPVTYPRRRMSWALQGCFGAVCQRKRSGLQWLCPFYRVSFLRSRECLHLTIAGGMVAVCRERTKFCANRTRNIENCCRIFCFLSVDN